MRLVKIETKKLYIEINQNPYSRIVENYSEYAKNMKGKRLKIRKKDVPVIISYSGGTQSKALVHMAVNGHLNKNWVLPRTWAVIFADTGGEHRERYGNAFSTYEEVEQVKKMCIDNGITFIYVKNKISLSDYWFLAEKNNLSRIDQPPLYVDKYLGGRGRVPARCTYWAKIQPMRRAVSLWLKSQGLPKQVRKWIAISFDEIKRINKFKHDVQWEKCEFPLFNMGITKKTAIEYLYKNNITIPTRSLCVYCPNKSPLQWRETSGKDLDLAIEVDEYLRDCSDFGLNEGEMYLSNELLPIKDVKNKPLIVISDKDSMYCDSGHCFI